MGAFRFNEGDPIRVKKLNDLNERPVQIGFVGKPTASQVLWRGKAERAFTLKSLSGDSDNAATGAATFNLTADGVTVGTVAWSAASKIAVGTVITAAIAINAVLKLVAPASPDATLDAGTILITFGEG